MRLPLAALAGLAIAIMPAAAYAEGPEQLDQLEPGAGEWQTEYFGLFGKGGEREHALEAMYGVSDRLAVGLEAEGEVSDGDFAFETLGVKALYRFTDPEAPIGVGLQVQLGFDDEAKLAEAEARLIAEAHKDDWWAQANAMLRRTTEDGASSTGLAYGWSLQHTVADVAWFGLEGSGQSAPLSQDAGASAEHGHFAGPSLTFDLQPSEGTEIEIGFAYLRRLGGDGPSHTGRLFIQLSF
jgi:hypothetical protein